QMLSAQLLYVLDCLFSSCPPALRAPRTELDSLGDHDHLVAGTTKDDVPEPPAQAGDGKDPASAQQSEDRARFVAVVHRVAPGGECAKADRLQRAGDLTRIEPNDRVAGYLALQGDPGANG